MTKPNNQRLPTCRDCDHLRVRMLGAGFLCGAPVPKWVELQGQSEDVGQDDDATDCICFTHKDWE